jgi:hypothetical protein
MRMRHIIICGLPRSTMFFSYKRQDYIKETLFNIRRGLWFSLQILSETFWHSKKNLGSYDKKYTKIFMQRSRYACQILVKTEFSLQIFEKILKY